MLGCSSSLVKTSAGYTITSCEGTPVSLSHLPYATVQVGKVKQNIGTLTGDALFTSVSSALSSVCPKPTGGKGDCGGKLATIPDIAYSEENRTLVEGDSLELAVHSATYDTENRLDAFIKTAASTFANSTTGKNCWSGKLDTHPTKLKERQISDPDILPPTSEEATLCNAGSFAGVQLYDGKNDDGAKYWFDTDFTFKEKKGNGADFFCEFIVDTLTETIGFLAPELFPELEGLDILESAGNDLLTVACEDAMS